MVNILTNRLQQQSATLSSVPMANVLIPADGLGTNEAACNDGRPLTAGAASNFGNHAGPIGPDSEMLHLHHQQGDCSLAAETAAFMSA